jgi:hypothetical protein
MDQQRMREAIDAMEEATQWILENVKPGTPGKVDIATQLTSAAVRLSYSHAYMHAGKEKAA